MRLLICAILFTTQLILILGSAPLLRIQDKCRISDSACLTARAQIIAQAFAQGIPETGFDQLDVMLIDNVNINREDLKFFMKNIHVNGLKNSVIDLFSIDRISKLIRLVYRVDMSVSSRYLTNGYLFSLPVAGEGDFNVKLDNVQFDMQMPYEIVKDIYGREVIDLKGLDYSYDVKTNAEYCLSNLYYGDKQSSDTMHYLANTNWKFLTVEYGKYLFDAVNTRFFNAFRKFMLTQPIRDTLLLK